MSWKTWKPIYLINSKYTVLVRHLKIKIWTNLNNLLKTYFNNNQLNHNNNCIYRTNIVIWQIILRITLKFQLTHHLQ